MAVYLEITGFPTSSAARFSVFRIARDFCPLGLGQASLLSLFRHRIFRFLLSTLRRSSRRFLFSWKLLSGVASRLIAVGVGDLAWFGLGSGLTLRFGLFDEACEKESLTAQIVEQRDGVLQLC